MSQHLEHQLVSLKRSLLSLVTLVEEIVQKSVTSLTQLDKSLAKEVLLMDDKIDQEEVNIEEDCLKILALYQPVATDLRHIVGVLKMNNDLERIGDLAVNIAERTLYILKESSVPAPFDLTPMYEKTGLMLNEAINSLIDMDVEQARNVINMDDEVDNMNRQMYAIIFSAIKETPEHVSSLMNYLSASRHLERIADYTTNIAEDVIYMAEGIIIRHSPEKYD